MEIDRANHRARGSIARTHMTPDERSWLQKGWSVASQFLASERIFTGGCGNLGKGKASCYWRKRLNRFDSSTFPAGCEVETKPSAGSTEPSRSPAHRAGKGRPQRLRWSETCELPSVWVHYSFFVLILRLFSDAADRALCSLCLGSGSAL